MPTSEVSFVFVLILEKCVVVRGLLALLGDQTTFAWPLWRNLSRHVGPLEPRRIRRKWRRSHISACGVQSRAYLYLGTRRVVRLIYRVALVGKLILEKKKKLVCIPLKKFALNLRLIPGREAVRIFDFYTNIGVNFSRWLVHLQLLSNNIVLWHLNRLYSYICTNMYVFRSARLKMRLFYVARIKPVT